MHSRFREILKTVMHISMYFYRLMSWYLPMRRVNFVMIFDFLRWFFLGHTL